jgi:hypothetical protein
MFRICASLNIDKIILATNCTKLTIEILSNVSLGKAAHLHTEVALKDVRNNCSVLRPLRLTGFLLMHLVLRDIMLQLNR